MPLHLSGAAQTELLSSDKRHGRLSPDAKVAWGATSREPEPIGRDAPPPRLGIALSSNCPAAAVSGVGRVRRHGEALHCMRCLRDRPAAPSSAGFFDQTSDVRGFGRDRKAWGPSWPRLPRRGNRPPRRLEHARSLRGRAAAFTATQHATTTAGNASPRSRSYDSGSPTANQRTAPYTAPPNISPSCSRMYACAARPHDQHASLRRPTQSPPHPAPHKPTPHTPQACRRPMREITAVNEMRISRHLSALAGETRAAPSLLSTALARVNPHT